MEHNSALFIINLVITMKMNRKVKTAVNSRTDCDNKNNNTENEL